MQQKKLGSLRFEYPISALLEIATSKQGKTTVVIKMDIHLMFVYITLYHRISRAYMLVAQVKVSAA